MINGCKSPTLISYARLCGYPCGFKQSTYRALHPVTLMRCLLLGCFPAEHHIVVRFRSSPDLNLVSLCLCYHSWLLGQHQPEARSL